MESIAAVLAIGGIAIAAISVFLAMISMYVEVFGGVDAEGFVIGALTAALIGMGLVIVGLAFHLIGVAIA